VNEATEYFFSSLDALVAVAADVGLDACAEDFVCEAALEGAVFP
jgi:hypothetical protein